MSRGSGTQSEGEGEVLGIAIGGGVDSTVDSGTQALPDVPVTPEPAVPVMWVCQIAVSHSARDAGPALVADERPHLRGVGLAPDQHVHSCAE